MTNFMFKITASVVSIVTYVLKQASASHWFQLLHMAVHGKNRGRQIDETLFTVQAQRT